MSETPTLDVGTQDVVAALLTLATQVAKRGADADDAGLILATVMLDYLTLREAMVQRDRPEVQAVFREWMDLLRTGIEARIRAYADPSAPSKP